MLRLVKNSPLLNVVRWTLFVLCAFTYLYLGYHIRNSIIDFSTFSYINHPGVVEEDYVTSISEIDNVITLQSRWLTNLFTTLMMILLVSVMVYLVFLKFHYFYISCVFYTALTCLCILFIFIGGMVNDKGLGYEYARFIKDHLVQTPFVFILLVASLRVFKL